MYLAANDGYDSVLHCLHRNDGTLGIVMERLPIDSSLSVTMYSCSRLPQCAHGMDWASLIRRCLSDTFILNQLLD